MACQGEQKYSASRQERVDGVPTQHHWNTHGGRGNQIRMNFVACFGYFGAANQQFAVVPVADRASQPVLNVPAKFVRVEGIDTPHP